MRRGLHIFNVILIICLYLVTISVPYCAALENDEAIEKEEPSTPATENTPLAQVQEEERKVDEIAVEEDEENEVDEDETDDDTDGEVGTEEVEETTEVEKDTIEKIEEEPEQNEEESIEQTEEESIEQIEEESTVEEKVEQEKKGVVVDKTPSTMDRIKKLGTKKIVGGAIGAWGVAVGVGWLAQK